MFEFGIFDCWRYPLNRYPDEDQTHLDQRGQRRDPCYLAEDSSSSVRKQSLTGDGGRSDLNFLHPSETVSRTSVIGRESTSLDRPLIDLAVIFE